MEFSKTYRSTGVDFERGGGFPVSRLAAEDSDSRPWEGSDRVIEWLSPEDISLRIRPLQYISLDRLRTC